MDERLQKTVTLPDEIHKYAMQRAKQYASKTYAKLGNFAPSGFTVDEIEGELLYSYVKEMDRINKDGDWKNYVTKILQSYSKDLLAKVFDNRSREAVVVANIDIPVAKEFNDDETVEHVIIDNRDPETICIQEFEEKAVARKVEILLDDIKQFCEEFCVDFNEEDPMDSLHKVLKVTLNEMPDEIFNELDAATRRRLAQLGDAMVAKGLYIRTTGKKVRMVGITGVVRELVASGVVDTTGVMKALDDRGILYNKNSVQGVVYEERRKLGLSNNKERPVSVMSIVRKEFDHGRGIVTLPEMGARLKELGVHFMPSSLSYAVYELRRQYGLTKKNV